VAVLLVGWLTCTLLARCRRRGAAGMLKGLDDFVAQVWFKRIPLRTDE
jgi:hypothetical protein